MFLCRRALSPWKLRMTWRWGKNNLAAFPADSNPQILLPPSLQHRRSFPCPRTPRPVCAWTETGLPTGRCPRQHRHRGDRGCIMSPGDPSRGGEGGSAANTDRDFKQPQADGGSITRAEHSQSMLLTPPQLTKSADLLQRVVKTGFFSELPSHDERRGFAAI